MINFSSNLFRYCANIGLGMDICLRPKILGELCGKFPKRLILDHDFDISNVEKYLSNYDFSNGPVLKIIIFVRDPRGVANSLEFLKICSEPDNDKTCVDVPKLCNRLNTEVTTGNLI